MNLHDTKAIKSWGGIVREKHFKTSPYRQTDISDVFNMARMKNMPLLAHGMGRSYGDSCLNPNNIIVDMLGLDRFIVFNRETGILRAEAGVSLDEIMRVIVPHGWFVPTTPGTKFVTLGGAIANDVHGKNHHSAGSFGNHVKSLGLERSDQGHIEIGPDTDRDLFSATVGGLGLTGLIKWVEIQLVKIRSAFIKQTSVPFKSVNDFFKIIKEIGHEYEHTVAWIDCTSKGKNLGRGIFTGGNWGTDENYITHDGPKIKLPIYPPNFTLNKFTLRAFNKFYNMQQTLKPRNEFVPYWSHFHPLDSIHHWNRFYGRKGFYQYQSVIPLDNAEAVTRDMLKIIQKSGQGSMLAVLKTMGNIPSRGILSFPMPGVTLALDFQNKGTKTLKLMSDLDEIILQAKGRLYPAKDGRMSHKLFRTSYPHWKKVEKLKDPMISSHFWRRVSVS